MALKPYHRAFFDATEYHHSYYLFINQWLLRMDRGLNIANYYIPRHSETIDTTSNQYIVILFKVFFIGLLHTL